MRHACVHRVHRDSTFSSPDSHHRLCLWTEQTTEILVKDLKLEDGLPPVPGKRVAIQDWYADDTSVFPGSSCGRPNQPPLLRHPTRRPPCPPGTRRTRGLSGGACSMSRTTGEGQETVAAPMRDWQKRVHATQFSPHGTLLAQVHINPKSRIFAGGTDGAVGCRQRRRTSSIYVARTEMIVRSTRLGNGEFWQRAQSKEAGPPALGADWRNSAGARGAGGRGGGRRQAVVVERRR